MMKILELLIASILMLGFSSQAADEEVTKPDRYPTKLAPENRVAYGALLDQLDANSAKLRDVF